MVIKFAVSAGTEFAPMRMGFVQLVGKPIPKILPTSSLLPRKKLQGIIDFIYSNFESIPSHTYDHLLRLKAEKRLKDQQRKQRVTENRKHLANVRVVQKNLVFVVGLPMRLADADVS